MDKSNKYYGKFALGEQYGKWTVANPNLVYNDKSQAKAFVKCECGTEKYVYVTHLLSGKSKSCGCSLTARSGSNNPNYKGEGELSGMKLKSVNLSNNTTFTAPELSNLAQSQSYYCSWSGLPITETFSNATITTYTGHPWSSATVTYYTDCNSASYAWTHEDIATMKGNLNDDYFIELCHRVAERHPRPNPVITEAKQIADRVNKKNPVIDAAQQIANKYNK